MLALVKTGPGPGLELKDVPPPGIGINDVLIKVRKTGICGTDLHIEGWDPWAAGAITPPLVVGHEFVGEIAEVGSNVSDFHPGEIVSGEGHVVCGRCRHCLAGRRNLCAHAIGLGVGRDGAFAEYVSVPPQNLIPVPDGVSMEAASMTEPAAVALHALKRAGGGLVGETVVVFGAGPIGLMVAQWARVMGAARIVLFDLVPEKLAMARQLGFDLVRDARSCDPVEKINQLTGGQGAEVCVEAAGVPATLNRAIAAARVGGRVVILGNPSADVTLPAPLISQAMRRELDLLGAWNSSFSAAGNNDDWRVVLAAVASGAIDLDCLVTHRVPLKDALAALLMMRDQSEFFAKVLIEP